MSAPDPAAPDGEDGVPAGDPGGDTGLIRSSAAVAAGTLLSRVTGLGRVAVLAYAIGRGTLADTYNLANTTPNIVYELILGGVLTATLVPLFVEHARRRDEHATSAVFTVAMSVLVVLSVLAVLAAPWIARLYTFRGGDAAVQQEVATDLIRLFMPQMCFYGLTALASAMLHARGRFVAAAFAPVLNNLVVIGALGAFVRLTSGPRQDWVAVDSIRDDTGLVLLLGLGTTGGIVAMGMCLLPALGRAGVTLRLVPDWRHPAVRRMVRLSGWTIGYVIANQIALTVVLVLANGVEGGVAAYQYAFIFFQLPHGLFAVSIMTTMTPELARHATDGDLDGLRSRFAQGLRLLVVVVLPAAAAYLVLAGPLLGLMRFGAFGAADVAFTADVLRVLALGLVSFSIYLYTLRGFYALQDTRTPFLVNSFENVVNIVLALALFPSLGIPGLALAYAAAYGIASLVALFLLRRRVGALEGRATLRLTYRVVTAAVALALVCAGVVRQLPSATPAQAAGALVLATAAGGAIYLGALRALRVDEIRDVAHALLRRRRRPPDVSP